jgi:hypothetical protein
MSATTDWAIEEQAWEETLTSLRAFRIFRVTPDRERIAEWDRRRGKPLAPYQKNAVSAAVRIINETLWPEINMDEYKEVLSPKGHLVRIVLAKKGQPAVIRVGLGHDDPDGWLEVDMAFDDGKG